MAKSGQPSSKPLTQSELDRWVNVLADYIGRNIDVWRKCHVNSTLSEVRITYEMAEYIIMEVCACGEWHKIDYDKDECSPMETAEDRDMRKECRYLGMLWDELSMDRDEKQCDGIVSKARDTLMNKYNACVSLIKN